MRAVLVAERFAAGEDERQIGVAVAVTVAMPLPQSTCVVSSSD